MQLSTHILGKVINDQNTYIFSYLFFRNACIYWITTSIRIPWAWVPALYNALGLILNFPMLKLIYYWIAFPSKCKFQPLIVKKIWTVWVKTCIHFHWKFQFKWLCHKSLSFGSEVSLDRFLLYQIINIRTYPSTICLKMKRWW